MHVGPHQGSGITTRPQDHHYLQPAIRPGLSYKSCPWRRGWFELPATQITDEVKRDLRLLHLRSALDPKRFYKGFDQTKFPKYFQLGTVVEGAAEFYSGKVLGCGATRVSVCLLSKHQCLIIITEVFVLSPWTGGSLLMWCVLRAMPLSIYAFQHRGVESRIAVTGWAMPQWSFAKQCDEALAVVTVQGVCATRSARAR